MFICDNCIKYLEDIKINNEYANLKVKEFSNSNNINNNTSGRKINNINNINNEINVFNNQINPKLTNNNIIVDTRRSNNK